MHFVLLFNCPTCQHHPLLQTFLEATELTPVSLSFVNFTVAVCHTSVDSLVLNSPLEESLASLTCDDAIVQASGLVLADHADHWLVVLALYKVFPNWVVEVLLHFLEP